MYSIQKKFGGLNALDFFYAFAHAFKLKYIFLWKAQITTSNTVFSEQANKWTTKNFPDEITRIYVTYTPRWTITT